MKTFRFRGESVLEWRRSQADAARLEVVRATASAREAEERVAEAAGRSARAADDLVAIMRGMTDVDAIGRHRIWIARQQDAAGACQRLLDERRAAANRAVGVLQAANRHVKMMERLRERAHRRYFDAGRRIETREIDELAASRFARRPARKRSDS